MRKHTTNKHTPGPWTVDASNSIHGPGNDPEKTMLAAVRFQGGANNRGDANARLIAAAPDLLAALKELWGYCEDLQKSNPGYPGKLVIQDYGRLNNALILVPQAIAKAEGQA